MVLQALYIENINSSAGLLRSCLALYLLQLKKNPAAKISPADDSV